MTTCLVGNCGQQAAPDSNYCVDCWAEVKAMQLGPEPRKKLVAPRMHGKHWIPDEVKTIVGQRIRDEDWERLADEIIKVAEASSVRKTAIRWGTALAALVIWLAFTYALGR